MPPPIRLTRPLSRRQQATPYLYGQLFTGYGETLLNYDHPLTAIRVGIGFTDRSTRSQ
jgi:outer membrane phospholipase A